ncbi:MAG: PKD domain-containing protein [Breznakibacter sp.]
MDAFRRIAVACAFCLPGFMLNAQVDCNYNGQSNKFTPVGLCAPVDVTWEVDYSNVVLPVGANIDFEFRWDDGSPAEIVSATLVDPVTRKYSATLSHRYEKDPTVQKCVYQPAVRYMVNGVACTNSQQLQTLKVFNTDNKNSNQDLIINPEVFRICVGNDGTVTFKDESIWNCEPPDQQIQDGPNDRKRWIQWVYGTNAAESVFIGDALVDGLPRTFPFSGPVEVTSEPIYNPIPPWNTTMPIYVNDTRLVGDRFEIELRNWNQCNPYDDPNIPGPPADLVNGDYPPITKKAYIVIVPNPDATITSAGPFCANDSPVTLGAATSGGTWSGTGITSGSKGTFSPSVAGSGTHVITYTVTNSNGCSDTDTEVFVVNEVPRSNISSGPQTNLCPGALLQLNGNPTGGTLPYTHLWTGNVSPLSDVNIQTPDFHTTVAGIYDLTYQVTDDNGCKSQAITQVDVSYISIQFDQPLIDVCAGIPVALDPNPQGGSGVYVEHKWTGVRTDLLSADDVDTPTFNSSTPGTFVFGYYIKDSQGCDATGSVTVIVRDLPVANAGADTVLCGLEHTLGAVPSLGTGFWSLESGPGTVTFGDDTSPTSNITVTDYGTYRLKWEETNFSCVSEAYVNVAFVRVPAPVAMKDAEVCGLNHTIEVTPDVGGTWQQQSGPGNAVFANTTLALTTVSVDIPGTYVFVWFEDNGNGCVGSDDVQIKFFPKPVPVVQPFDPLGCNPYPVQFDNQTEGADNYLWDFGDGMTANVPNPQHIFVNPTANLLTFNVKLKVSNNDGCADSLGMNVSVAPAPLSSFKPDKIKGCSPLEVYFTNQSQGAQNYNWSFGDGTAPGATSVDASHTFVNANNYVTAYEVALAVSNQFGCVDTSRQYISVYPQLDIDFTAVPTAGCSPLRVDFLADAGAQVYNWDFGDGTSLTGAMSASRLYEVQGGVSTDYKITLNTSSVFGCIDVTEKTVTVNPSPTAMFTPDKTEGCHPLDVTFANQSDNVVKSWWKVEGGDIFEAAGAGGFSHTFTNTTYGPVWSRVRLVVENTGGCRDSIDKPIQVFPSVGASISPADPGCSPLNAVFQNTTTGGRTFTWDYGDGHTSSGYVGANVFVANSDEVARFNVQMTATSTYGCVETAYTYVDVWPTPKPQFTADPELQTMPSSTVTFTNQTQGDGWQYQWDLGDGNISVDTHPVHRYALSGNYTVWLIARGEQCIDSVAKSIRILPMVPQISYGPNAEGCPPLTVEFYNHTPDANLFLWDFGDNNSSEAKEPVHTYVRPGIYKVTLTADGPGGRSIANDLEIVVYEEPVAFFDLDPRVTVIPEESVRFRDRSTGNVVSWTWDFGDGNKSTEQNPIHKYAEEGLYDVGLIVENDKGCPDSYLMVEAVRAKTGGQIKFPNAFTPSTSGPSGGVYDKYDRDNKVFFPFTQEGVVEYKLQIFTRWGELIFESNDVGIGWDGYFKGKLSAMGVYIWTARVKFSDGRTKTFTGDVTLLR